MIFEIKKSINGNLHLVNYAGLSQTLLECLYCGQQYGAKRIVGCLTDVTTWHFMSCEYVESQPMVSVTGSHTEYSRWERSI